MPQIFVAAGALAFDFFGRERADFHERGFAPLEQGELFPCGLLSGGVISGPFGRVAEFPQEHEPRAEIVLPARAVHSLQQRLRRFRILLPIHQQSAEPLGGFKVVGVAGQHFAGRADRGRIAAEFGVDFHEFPLRFQRLRIVLQCGSVLLHRVGQAVVASAEEPEAEAGEGLAMGFLSGGQGCSGNADGLLFPRGDVGFAGATNGYR